MEGKKIKSNFIKMLGKITIFLIVAISVSLACDGNCAKCHPNLIKNREFDKNHKILKSCIDCHKITSKDLNRMGAVCGEDCWQCHSIDKVMSIPNKSHLSLNKCIDCHEGLKKENLYQMPFLGNQFQK